MALPNVFTPEVSEGIIGRINGLNPQSKPNWGKMSVAQMLAHCCVTYEYVYNDKYKTPNFLVRLMLKLFVKNAVVNETPYKHDNRTAPDFIIVNDRDFESEKQRLIGFIKQTQTLGSSHFDGKESHSFGKLTQTEWNNMFYKHLDHHLRQFGV